MGVSYTGQQINKHVSEQGEFCKKDKEVRCNKDPARSKTLEPETCPTHTCV